ncbi:MAG: ABC transporter ATP-binding protein [Elusimicrobiota bacterium]
MDISAKNLQKNYTLDKGIEIKAIRDVSFEIKQGETVAVMGPSGAGKSTLLHLIGLMDKPSSGNIAFDGMDSAGMADKQRAGMRRNKIGFLFQLHYLLPEFDVLENVLIPAWAKRSVKRKDAVALLESLGLNERMDHLPSELSGGEQQRAALARAFINDPELLLADEPTGDLDRENGEKVEKIMFDECKKRNVTLVIVTHNEELAKKAGRIIMMRDGMITTEPAFVQSAEQQTKQSVQQKYFL